MRKVAETFRLLSNEINVELLVLLSSGEFNPRELAKVLGRDETDVSRRLRRLEKAGLVIGEWKRVAGRNIRVYRLRGNRFCLRLTSEGIVLDSSSGLDPRQLAKSLKVALLPPKPPYWFTGRRRELGMLENTKAGLVVVIGLPGSGKTSLLSVASHRWRGPVAWYTITGFESLYTFLWRLSLYLSILGEQALFEYLGAPGEIDPVTAAKILASSMDKLGLSLVVDDFHKLADPAIALLLAELAKRIESSRIVLASRRRPSSLLAEVPGARVMVLGGLGMEEASELLTKLGLDLGVESLSALYIATQGHPLLLKIFSELASREGIDKALEMIESRRFGDELWRGIIASLSEAEAEVLNLLIDLEEPVPLELIEALCKCRSPAIAVYKLLDLGLVDEINNRYMARDILRRLCPRRAPRYHVLQAAGNWFLDNGGAEGVILAIRLYSKAKDERQIVRAIRKRMREIGYGMEPLAEAYARELERALEAVRSRYVRNYILAELAIAMNVQGNIKEAYEYLEEAYIGAKRYQDIGLLIRVIGLLLRFYPLMLSDEKARQLVEEAEELIKRHKLSISKMPDTMGIYYANLARYHMFRGEKEEALNAIKMELEAAKMLGDKLKEEALARAHLAIALAVMNRYEEALEEATKALDSALLESSSTIIARTQWILAELYLRTGRFHEAYRTSYEAYMALRQKLRDNENIAALLDIQLLALLQQGSLRPARSVAKKLLDTIMKIKNRTGSIRGLELELLTVAAAHKALGLSFQNLVREAIESLRERNAKLPLEEVRPYIEVLEKTGLKEEASFLQEIAT